MLFSSTGIGQKLFITFTVMIALMAFGSVVGVLGFSYVEKTERTVIDSAIPAVIEARYISDLSTKIISTSQLLSQVNVEDDRNKYGKELFSAIESLYVRLKGLGVYPFDKALLSRLDQQVQDIVDNLATMGDTVGEKVVLHRIIQEKSKNLTQTALQLEELARSQVLNSNTITIANVVKIYDLVENGNKNDVYEALDTLVEIDLDLAERLHELRLLTFKVVNTIDDARNSHLISQVEKLRQDFTRDMTIITRRIQAVEDPSRTKQMLDLASNLTHNQRLFSELIKLINLNNELKALSDENIHQFQRLNLTIEQLLNQANEVTQQAVADVNFVLKIVQQLLISITLLGLCLVIYIMWRYVYARVLTRLNQYERALMDVANGKLDIELDTSGDDELAQMGRSILVARDTAQELQEHKDSLELQVAQRTQELKSSNERLNVEIINHDKARDLAEQANRAKSAFLATMSHEIRTPLNGVLGTGELLRGSRLTAQQKQYVDIINRSGENLLDLLNDILDYSKIEAGHLSIRKSNFNVHSIVTDVHHLFSSRAQQKGITLDFNIPPETPLWWIGDCSRIRQVLNNFVGNAIKFTHTGSVSIQLHVILETTLLFEVIDTGAGIAEHEIDSLFDAFTQAEEGQKVTGGTGLGLAISQRLIEAMEGEIGVDSKEGIGSAFWFSLELEEGHRVEVSNEICAISDLAPAHLLLVEDNPVNQMVATGFLERLGHKVTAVDTGQLAEEQVKEHQFDMLLLDINLPDTDGVTLQKRLRAIENEYHGEGCYTPTLAVSAHVFTEDVESYLAAGFDGFLGKPLVENQLVQMLNRFLRDQYTVINTDSYEPNERVETEQNENNEMIIDEKVIQGDVTILGKDRMTKIIGLFVHSSKINMSELQQAIVNKEAYQVNQLAHKLKGSAGSLGLMKLYALCHEYEKASKEGDISICNKDELQNTYDNSVIAVEKIIL
ncbi:TMAO reductase system sensor histidine kinase/response regulator TorS [Aliivibrio sp. SR45-2]|uniref:TMAO reductase system sensor histidine kinase/response regulator TorS n=1 Tax=Aliivibrio sp. SR45-2 TaxID=2760931 RepID=UPI0015FB9B83|nr:TMAO reductase system sensor histidine kinase/response regulator TorS [Aliivibrio sp. SR45-2]MBB1312447.1 TMAO reductase system sensor histidine kinase/response regulator TorS [Aliivibrio sp. SR45-2]